MKKTIIKSCTVFALVFLSSCEKESIMSTQSNDARILSSNPDEIFVEDTKSDKWISLTEQNKKFPLEKEVQLYAKHMCIVTINGQQVTGSVCSRDDYNGCNSNIFQCIQK